MKLFLVSLFCLILSFSSAQTSEPIRHFMQEIPSPSDAIPYGNNPKTGNYAHSGDAKIYYEVYGKGKPFVVLHGGGLGSIYEMHQFIDSLSKSFKVIAITTRGHGKSELGSGPTSIQQKADDVLAVIEAQNLSKVSILGFSDGAYSGYSFAATYPNRIEKLIAIGTGEETPELRKITMDLPELFNLDPAFRDQQLTLMPQPERLKEMGDRMAKFYNSISFSKELLGKIQCPVLLMAGEKDQNAPLSSIITAYLMIPNSQLSIIPNTGHVTFIENFPAVWQGMLPFLMN